MQRPPKSKPDFGGQVARTRWWKQDWIGQLLIERSSGASCRACPRLDDASIMRSQSDAANSNCSPSHAPARDVHPPEKSHPKPSASIQYSKDFAPSPRTACHSHTSSKYHTAPPYSSSHLPNRDLPAKVCGCRLLYPLLRKLRWGRVFAKILGGEDSTKFAEAKVVIFLERSGQE
jgi:hypothetical protein